MSQISIVLDDNSRYTIELVDKYSPEEFISAFENHISKVRKLMPSLGESGAASLPNLSAGKVVNTELFKSPLFVKLNAMIENYCKNIKIKDNKSMRSFIYTKPIKGANKRAKTVTWLRPSGHKLHVILQCRRNEDYSKIDSGNKVIYNPPELGKYPYIKVRHEEEIEYAFNLIKYAYDSMESTQ
jgi:hypothetical protein